MKKQSEWKNDRKRVAVLLQKTHGGQDLTTAEYNIVMAYWRGQKSQKELFDRVFERVVGLIGLRKKTAIRRIICSTGNEAP